MAALSRDVGVAPTFNYPADSTPVGAMPVGATPTSRRLKTPPKPHSKDLRKGRFSQPNQVYLLTTVTQNREPIFIDFTAARILINTLKTEQALNRSNTLAFVIMPDHLHWLMQLTSQTTLANIMQSIKTRSAKQIGKPIWQPGFHDHALRKEEDLKATARYIIANPPTRRFG